MIAGECEVLDADRYRFAAMVLRDQGVLPAAIVYDVGAGRGVMRRAVEEMHLVWRGWDMAPANAAIRKWDLNEPCPEGGAVAGAVLLLDVIEHLRNPGLALRHVGEALVPGGLLLVSTPNPRWSRSRVDALRTGYPTCFSQADLDGNSHVLPIWPHVLRALLREAGFAVGRYVTLDGATRWPRPAATPRYPLRLAGAALCKWIEWRDRSARGMSYAMVARKTGAAPPC